MAYEFLIVEHPADGIALITLNRPQAHNALNVQMFSELNQAVVAANVDDEVRVIVITGAGDKAFSAGYDVKELVHFTPDEQKSDYYTRDQWMWQVASSRKPVIAAMNGMSYGGGSVLAMACDIRIGCARTSFKVTAANYNGINATWSLPAIVTNGIAKEWLMTGRLVTAAEARAEGLLNHLVDEGKVLEKALEVAAAIAANAPAASQAVKFMIDDNIGRRRADAQRAETAFMLTHLPPGKVADLFVKFLSKTKQK